MPAARRPAGHGEIRTTLTIEPIPGLDRQREHPTVYGPQDEDLVMLSIIEMKKAARVMHTAGEASSHSAALEAVAHKNGYRDWNTAAALAPKDPQVWRTRADIDPHLQRLAAMFAALPRSGGLLGSSPVLSEEYLAAGDAFFGSMLQVTDEKLAVATGRYMLSAQGLKLTLYLTKMPNLATFVSKHYDLIMGEATEGENNFWINAYYPELGSPAARR